MKKIFIIDMHWNNRGDEAANRAMIEGISSVISESRFMVQVITTNYAGTEVFAEKGIEVLESYFPRQRDILEWIFVYISKGRLTWTKEAKEFIRALKKCDVVIHAPGGPSIGDIYLQGEFTYLQRLLLVKRLNKPYFFYAPSMGPFDKPIQNIFRKKILKNAMGITLREEISGNYLHKLLPNKKYEVTLDSAFQAKIDTESSETILKRDDELNKFINTYEKIVGITITDLQWNPLYKDNQNVKKNIKVTFEKFLDNLVEKGYGILFIPQLFAAQDDYVYMSSFKKKNMFILNRNYDCYFQQYIISKLFAVVGMRYHSNIFSCKMGIPFVSISYEQKMKGFMEKVGLSDYCISIHDLEYSLLKNKFSYLEDNYLTYKTNLFYLNVDLYKESKKTTDILIEKMKKEGILCQIS